MSAPFEDEYFGGLDVRGSITRDVVRVNQFIIADQVRDYVLQGVTRIVCFDTPFFSDIC